MDTNSVKNILVGILIIFALVLGGLIIANEQRFILSASQENSIRILMERSGINFTDYANITRDFRPRRQLVMHRYEFDLESIAYRFFEDEPFEKTESNSMIEFESETRRITYSIDENSLLFEIEPGYTSPEFLATGHNNASSELLANQYIETLLGRQIDMKLHTTILTSRGDYVLNYFGSFRGYDIFNNHLRIRVTNHGITRIRLSAFIAEDFSGEQMSIYSGDEAILALINHLRETGVISTLNISNALGRDMPRIEISSMHLFYYLEETRYGGARGQKASPSYVFSVIITNTVGNSTTSARFNYIFNAYTNSFIRHELVQ
ncbi:MAG: hypothetical protein FWD01_01320 [Defluviitaleaceae bacterium]|nr:hypothetical protein [Defluviitaleaceae bacterium]